MAIQKQEFYEGAALHLLARTGRIAGIRYEAPFFCLNDQTLVLLKHSTKGRSPWGFTFTVEEQRALQAGAAGCKAVIGLICGADGVAGMPYEAYLTIATPRKAAIHIACYRAHGGYYEVSGPDGTLNKKIAPSTWQRFLDDAEGEA